MIISFCKDVESPKLHGSCASLRGW